MIESNQQLMKHVQKNTIHTMGLSLGVNFKHQLLFDMCAYKIYSCEKIPHKSVFHGDSHLFHFLKDYYRLYKEL